MWVMTTRGFYSVVAYQDDIDDPQLVRVRARSKADIDNLYALFDEYMALCRDDVSQPYADPSADYLWRIDMPESMWEYLVGLMAREVEYSEFLDAVDKLEGYKSRDVYAAVWGGLLQLEPPGERAWQDEDIDDEDDLPTR